MEDMPASGYNTNNVTFTEEIYTHLMDKKHVTSEWFLVKSPLPILSVLLIYLLLVFKIGPAFMKDRGPYKLKGIMRFYNIVQIICNISFFHTLFMYSNYLPYMVQTSCRLPQETDDNVDELKELYFLSSWNFLVLKILDLLDTIFMVLRKKNSHITFLHVYHHAAMVFFVWFTMKYIQAPQALIPGIINAFVHTVMYTYYFLATYSSGKLLWWKKYLTKLQLTQFGIILVYLSVLYYNNCPVPKAFTFIWMFNTVLIAGLFVDFYVKAYILKTGKKIDLKTD